jgi:hypothetical protein
MRVVFFNHGVYRNIDECTVQDGHNVSVEGLFLDQDMSYNDPFFEDGPRCCCGSATGAGSEIFDEYNVEIDLGLSYYGPSFDSAGNITRYAGGIADGFKY